jgi:hypothetical protein
MNRKKGKTLVLTFIAVSLLVQAAPALAKDYWHWADKEHRWEHRADLRSDHKDLDQARQQLRYDRSHHASRRTIARDEGRIREIERDIREDEHARR